MGKQTIDKFVAPSVLRGSHRQCNRGTPSGDGGSYVKEIGGILSGFILALIILILMSACSRKVYIPVESVTVRTDTVERLTTLLRVDTVTRTEVRTEYRLDSVAPILDSVGRMVGYDRWHVIDRSAELSDVVKSQQALIDALKTARSDSIRVREPYPVETVRGLSWWEKGLVSLGTCALVFLLLIGGILAWKHSR